MCGRRMNNHLSAQYVIHDDETHDLYSIPSVPSSHSKRSHPGKTQDRSYSEDIVKIMRL